MRYLILVAMISFAEIMNAQISTNTESTDSTNIYYQSLSIFCNSLHNKTEGLLIEQNNLTTNSLPSKIGNHEIRIIDMVELKKLLKENKDIEIVRIIPLRVKDGEFFVNIIYFDVKAEKRQFYFTNKGGYSVVFSFNSDNKQFIFKEIR